ncbi:alpha/beta fold hydrolase [Wenyingzhuangia marina]|uniref:Pimeloyl-ACP methyl ester carboxylesterase n=1 Tax=Wenyingzhuangia marina TaxID=1195760 RepID=A0A1M5SGG9_9FLAO|nr:alpha/beta hydrolase [Wenyingzhuangia marina]GGF62142.1 alpha/beta hydrolase [Wenyingzhuangia marina]SHH37634.1 Pimeloyl-ACP methyl ester carboxylesterase [Wenyingzhuangia marina]
MEYNVKTEGEFKYIEAGEGKTIIVLHGLMGTLDDFSGVVEHFSKIGYKVLVPELPIYTLPIIKTNVKNLAKFVKKFMEFKNVPHATLLGNSLGGHVSLYITKAFPYLVDSLVLTGSSGLYEKAMGDTYPKRGDYEYIKTKAEAVFYDPATATKKMVDDLFKVVNDRNCAIRILALAKSAIRHNMANDLPDMKIPTCLVWGKQDDVTPPEVADEFNKLMPNSELFWIDKCGHAPMMEHPNEFNEVVGAWFDKNSIK